MTQKQIFISQKFPWFGKLDLKTQQAVLKTQQQVLVLRGKKLELSRKIAAAYFDLAYLDAALETNAALTLLIRQALQVAETQYTTGRGLQQDIFQAQVELSKLSDENLTLVNRRRNQEAELNALLNRPTFAPVATEHPPPRADIELQEDKLRQAALENNPWLQIRALEVEAAELDLDLAEKDYWPDMDVRLAYGQRDEDMTGRDLPDFVSASVSMNIPLWQNRRQDRKVAAGRSIKMAAKQAYENLRLSLPHRIDALIADIRKEQESYRLYREQLINQTRDWSHSATAAYEVGKVDFDTMINARLRVLKFQLQAEKYSYNILKKRAELEEAMGAPLNPTANQPSDKQNPRKHS